MNPIKASVAAFAGVSVLALLLSAGKLFEDVGPDEIVVIQSPIEGRLDVYTTPGMKWQGWGEVTVYKKRSTYVFEQGEKGKGGIEVRFNDGGHGTIFGSIQYVMPEDSKSVLAIHSSYRSQEAVQKNLIETATNKSIYLVGTLMSSKESYAEKRNDLIYYVTDQIQNGIYRTRQKREWVKDPTTGQDKEVIAAEIVAVSGVPARQEEAVLNKFNIHAYNFTINKLPYDEAVEKQITQQQQITMDVQTSIANLKKAEQEKLTAVQQGEANATKARWEQELVKARAVVQAEQEKQVQLTNAERDRQFQLIAADRDKQVQLTAAERDRLVLETAATARLNVAELDKKAAGATKEKDIQLGQGESERRRLVLEADGALTQKLDAYVKVNAFYAESLKTGTWVPSVMMGTGQSGQQVGMSGAQDMISLLTAKAAKDLSLDLVTTRTPRK